MVGVDDGGIVVVVGGGGGDDDGDGGDGGGGGGGNVNTELYSSRTSVPKRVKFVHDDHYL